MHAIARSLLASVALALATSMHALLYEQEYGTVPYIQNDRRRGVNFEVPQRFAALVLFLPVRGVSRDIW